MRARQVVDALERSARTESDESNPDTTKPDTTEPEGTEAQEATPSDPRTDQDHPARLPTPATDIIGRTQEQAQLLEWLEADHGRLVTITGAAGSGKTRLALAVAATAGRFPGHRAYWVDLTSTADPQLVDSTIATALAVRSQPGRANTAVLAERLNDEHLNKGPTLLVLDNCEHLARSCASISGDLLAACPRLRILATSRVPLEGAESRTLLLEPLPVPLPVPEGQDVPPASLADVESVRLFTERARAALPSFTLTTDNASAVARICRTLDGLPLALELAAARVKILTTAQLAERLEGALAVLTRNVPTAARRHATLRRALDWSYELLSPQQRTLLDRLSVFSGGWELSDAESVCPGGLLQPGDILDTLSDLVDQSLVSVDSRREGTRRFRLLEVVRQYADERLRMSGDRSGVRARHAEHFAALTRQAARELNGPWQHAWMRRLDQNRANLREILGWGLTSPEGLEVGARAACDLSQFWQMRGEFEEGLGWHRRYLGSSEGLSDQETAELLDSTGFLAVHAGQAEEARGHWERAIEKFTSIGDFAGVGRQLNYLAHVTMGTDPKEAAALAARGVELERQAGDDFWVSACLLALGDSTFLQGDLEAAGKCYEESQAIARRLGNQFAIARRCVRLGQLARTEGDFDRARLLLAESLQTAQGAGDEWGVTMALAAFGSLAAATGDLETSAMLLGASQARLENYGARFWEVDRNEYFRAADVVRSLMGAEAYAASQKAGAASARDIESLAARLQNTEPPSTTARGTADVGGLLTRREAEVLELIATGESNQEIAGRLGLSIRTVERHIANLYPKIGVSGPAARTAAAHFAFRHGLASGQAALIAGAVAAPRQHPLPKS